MSYVLRLCHSLNPSLNALELLGSLLFRSSAYERCSNRARVLGFGIGRFPDRVIDLRHRCCPRCFSILPLFMVCYTFFHALLIFYRKKMETLAFINLLFLSLLPAQPAPATVKAVRRKTTIKKVDLRSKKTFNRSDSSLISFCKVAFYLISLFLTIISRAN